jgi:hypothetical protein
MAKVYIWLLDLETILDTSCLDNKLYSSYVKAGCTSVKII